MIGVQFMNRFIKPFLDVKNDILDIIVARHRLTMWLIFICVRVPELLGIGSKVEIWWNIILFCLLVLLQFVVTADGLHYSFLLLRRYQKIFITNQTIFPVSLPCG